MLCLPNDVLTTILEYDGQIKYRKGQYINIIHQNDYRYNIINTIVQKKYNILKNVIVDKNKSDFYFEFRFEGIKNGGLSYATGGWSGAAFTKNENLEICFYIFKTLEIVQHRTYL